MEIESRIDDRKKGIEAGDLIIHYLEQLDIEYVFGIPGGAIEPLYNALARSERRGGPRPIVARHESGAAFMAEGYTRETGKLGVVCTTTGPGATNAITGIVSAYVNQMPMLVITAQTPLTVFGKAAFQESSCTGINTLGIYEHFTRYNSLVSHIEQLEGKLISAIMTAHETPSGPSHLSIPLDVLRSPMSGSESLFNLPNLLRHPAMIDVRALDDLYQLVISSKKIVLVVGSGCAEGIGEILEFALLLQAAVVTTPFGKGFVSSYHPQFRGVFGFAGHRSAYDTLNDPSVDLILAVGTAMGEWSSSGWDEQALLNEKLVHIDSTPEHMTRSPMARLHIRGGILSVFQELLNSLYEKEFQGLVRLRKPKMQDMKKGKSEKKQQATSDKMPLPYIVDLPENPARHFNLNEERKYLSNSTPIKPQRLMRELARLFPLNTCFLCDTGNSLAWAVHYLHPFDRRTSGGRPRAPGKVNFGLEFSAMGWAIGNAIGAAIGRRNHPVVCIVGDGSVLMSGQEISVAVSEKLPVVFVVLNDSALGMVKHGQRLSGAEQIGFEIPPVDFCRLAKSMGADAYSIHSPEDLIALDIKAICSREGPTVFDVYIDPEEVPPIGVRIQALNELKN